MKSILIRMVVAILGLAWLSACASTDVMETTNSFSPVAGKARIVLIEPDVELSFLKAAGVSEVRADWSGQGRENVLREIEAILQEAGHEMGVHEIDLDDDRQVQMVRLHEVVGATILTHRFMNQPLPSKRKRFDWSLGPGVRAMADKMQADYALFLYARGEYASSGRQALAVGLAVLGGGGVSTGGQAAYASLVDMRTGDIVWFNVAFTTVGTDMRKPEGAKFMVETILKDIPL